MSERDLFTPQELVDEYPVLRRIGWNATKLGILYTMGLLVGKPKGRKVLISLESVKEMIKRRNDINLIDLSEFE